jgi:hypothetical protein
VTIIASAKFAGLGAGTRPQASILMAINKQMIMVLTWAAAAERATGIEPA